MKSIIAALLFCFIATGASALEEYPVSVPAFAVIVDDTANFQADGTPKRLRWGVCLYEATVESEAGALNFLVNYSAPEVALVTPADLQAGMIAVVEHETDF